MLSILISSTLMDISNGYLQHIFSCRKMNKLTKKMSLGFWMKIAMFQAETTDWVKISADDFFNIFFLFFPENRLCHFKQMVSSIKAYFL